MFRFKRALPGGVLLGGAVALVSVACGQDSPVGDATVGSGGSSTPVMTGGTSGASCNQERDYYLWETDLSALGGASFGGEGGAGVAGGEHIERRLTDRTSGLVQCVESTPFRSAAHINRAEAVDCGEPHWFYQPDVCGVYSPKIEGLCEGYSDLDWWEQGDSACSVPGCYVQYGCRTDDDCAAGQACVCAAARHDQATDRYSPARAKSQCIPAECRTNDDCPSGQCGLMSAKSCRIDDARLACRTPDDECQRDDECPDVSGYGGRCERVSGTDHWTCGSMGVCE